jgi:hypothetical protein
MALIFLAADAAEQHLAAANQSLTRILARQRGQVKEYPGRCLNPTQHERELLMASWTRLQAQLDTRFPWPLIVYIIVLQSGSYWDFPFTLDGDTIVWTRRYLKQHQSQDLRFEQSSVLDQVLLHELIHLDQKLRPAHYHRIFRELGFRPGYQAQIPPSLRPLLLGNPDGEDYDWAWKNPVDKELYLPLGLFSPRLGHITRLLRLRDNQLLPVTAVPAYVQRFGHKSVYHPNEITAELGAQACKIVH